MLSEKTGFQFPFLHALGSLSCMKMGSVGSLSCTPPSTRKGTIYYILEG